MHCDVWLPTIVAVNGVCTGRRPALRRRRRRRDRVVVGVVPRHPRERRPGRRDRADHAPARIGLGNALRFTVLGRHGRIGADEALRIGLVDEVVDPHSLLERAMERAEQAASGSPAAIEASKRAIIGALDRPMREALAHGWELLMAHRDAPRQHRGPEGLRREARAEVAVTDVDEDAAAAEAEQFFRQQLPADWVAAVDAGDVEALAAARRDVDPDEIWRRIAAGGYLVPTWSVEHGGPGAVQQGRRCDRSDPGSLQDAAVQRRRRRRPRGVGADAVGNRRAEGAVPHADRSLRGDLVPAVLRARRGLRPRHPRLPPCATATAGCSAARSCGRASVTSRRSASCWPAPTPRCPSTRASPRSSCRWASTA